MSIRYVVRPGDNLTIIGRRHGLSWRDIYYHADNEAFRGRRRNPNRIFPGDVVMIPSAGPTPQPAPPSPPVRIPIRVVSVHPDGLPEDTPRPSRWRISIIPPEATNRQIWQLVRAGNFRDEIRIDDSVRRSPEYRRIWEQEWRFGALPEILRRIPTPTPTTGPVGDLLGNIETSRDLTREQRVSAEQYLRRTRSSADNVYRYNRILHRLGRDPAGD